GGLVFDGTTDGNASANPNPQTNPNQQAGGQAVASPLKAFTVQATLASESYLWRVRSFVTSDWGPWSGYQPFTVTVGIASLRRPVEGESLGNGNVIFQWSPILGGDTFHLQIATRPEFSDPLIFDADVPRGTSFTLSTALADGTYYWRVRGAQSTLFS